MIKSLASVDSTVDGLILEWTSILKTEVQQIHAGFGKWVLLRAFRLYVILSLGFQLPACKGIADFLQKCHPSALARTKFSVAKWEASLLLFIFHHFGSQYWKDCLDNKECYYSVGKISHSLINNKGNRGWKELPRSHAVHMEFLNLKLATNAIWANRTHIGLSRHLG
ncbi:hypothetical protein VNO77_27309 [Canavalia gladiata]|uniref:Uncharacterized protein n=1 Tax=Canavalia gladiata TaxID=3824 RepID=A0AAN9KXM0_CANGL